MTLQTIFRACAWTLLVAILIVTLGPAGVRPQTDLPVNLERAIAYLLLGAAFAAAYPRHIWWAAVIALACAIGLEFLQNLRPDRHGREIDAIVKIGGAVVGLALGHIIGQRLRKGQSGGKDRSGS